MSENVVEFPMPPKPIPSREEQRQEARRLPARGRCGPSADLALDPEATLSLDEELFPARVVGRLLVEARKRKVKQPQLIAALREKHCNLTHIERYRVRPGREAKAYLSRNVATVRLPP